MWLQVLGVVTGAPAPALLLPRIPKGYVSLGNPPSFDTVTRDTYPGTTRFTVSEAMCVLSSLASVGAHLHARGISHGDLYAHNILIDRAAQHVLLVDFGAASFYDALQPRPLPLEQLEVRAFGCLMDDILSRTDSVCDDSWIVKALWALQGTCMRARPTSRPNFQQLVKALDRLGSANSAAAVECTAGSRKRVVIAAAVAAAVACFAGAVRK
jgi:serine/threonine protein kinase